MHGPAPKTRSARPPSRGLARRRNRLPLLVKISSRASTLVAAHPAASTERAMPARALVAHTRTVSAIRFAHRDASVAFLHTAGGLGTRRGSTRRHHSHDNPAALSTMSVGVSIERWRSRLPRLPSLIASA